MERIKLNKLPLNYKLKKRYRIIKYISESNFSNIYLVLYKNKKYIAKECFPLNIVIRDEENTFHIHALWRYAAHRGSECVES